MMSSPIRSTFTTSRKLEYFSEGELSKQTGHSRKEWPRVVLRELIDNALDACDEMGIAPNVLVRCDATSIEVSDNAGGIPVETVQRMLEFDSRTSSRAIYVAPDRGAQGNALKTLVGIAHVINGRLSIDSRQIRHSISIDFDVIRQEPVICHDTSPSARTTGTSVRLEWPASDSDHWPGDFTSDSSYESHLWWQLFGFAAINPHLTICLDWCGTTSFEHVASDLQWKKWKPSQPTSAYWYQVDDLVRLAAAYVQSNPDILIRDFLALFDGLSRTAKRKAVLDETGLQRARLRDLLSPDVDTPKWTAVLRSMQNNAQLVKPRSLGIIGREHLTQMLRKYGGADSIRYRKVEGDRAGVPYVLEAAFARLKGLTRAKFVTGANFSAGINDLFARSRGWIDDLDNTDPVLIFTHIVSPRLSFSDRGKGALLL
jgi:DNA topoisomerase VI subunit B